MARVPLAIQLGAIALAGAAVIVALPSFIGYDTILQITLNFAFAILALSLGFVWGYAGIFSFGQAAFFGLGGYAYAAAAINFGDSTPAILIGVLLPALFALVLGYFVFYARLSSIYVAVITLVVTLILYKFMGQTAKPSYMIGNAMLGGYNGIPAIPPLNVPGRPDLFAGPEEMFVIAGLTALAVYIGLRVLLAARLGKIVVGMRENELRMELLGFDTRFYKLVAFVIAAAIAGLGGVMFANWNAFIDPHVFGLGFSAQPIIWVMIGGLGTLIGPILGAFILSTLSLELGTQKTIDINLILGLVFTVFVLLVPQGIIPTLRKFWTDRRPARDPDAGANASREASSHG
ncbi:MAG: branched-chain amino acid ABC transporter permease [Rhizobiaceae bacterium]|nr:branched-chain amino acid ABC transporter permease [Rhizobiaceae bacterium]